MKTAEPKLTPRQYGMLLMTTMIGVGLKPLVHDIVTVARRDAWISVLIGAAVTWCGYALSVSLVRAHPQTRLADLARALLGRWAGALICLGYVAYWTFSAALTVRFFTELMRITFLTHTPQWAVLGLFIGTITLLAAGDVQRLARLREIFGLILLVVFALYVVALLFEVNFMNLLPVFEFGPGPALRAVPLTFWSIAGSETALVVGAHITTPHKLLRTGTIALALATFVPFSVTVLSVGLFGPKMAGEFVFTPDETLKFVDVPGILVARLDLVVITFWVLAIINAASGMQQAAVQTLQDLTGWSRGVLAVGLVPFVLTGAMVARSMDQMFVQVRWLALLTFVAGVAVPAVLWVTSRLRGGHRRGQMA